MGGEDPDPDAKKAYDDAVTAFEGRGDESWLSWGRVILPTMVLNVALRQVEAGRLAEKNRVEKAFAAALAASKNDDDNEDNDNNNNDDDDEDEDDEDDTTQKAASTKTSPKAARKVVATKPLPKVVEGSSKVTLVSFSRLLF